MFSNISQWATRIPRFFLPSDPEQRDFESIFEGLDLSYSPDRRFMRHPRNNITLCEDPRMGTVSYPVGDTINRNRASINRMGENIALMLKKIYSTDKEINLVCTGSSGAIIAALVSDKIKNLNKIIHVPKNNETMHRTLQDSIRSEDLDMINILVDDVIESGETIRCMLKEFEDFNIRINGICVTGKFNYLKFRCNPTPYDFVICTNYILD